jgi:hypothetical protein
MQRFSPIAGTERRTPLLASLLDKFIHPLRDPESKHDDPSRPFTPPPSQPSKDEKDDDDGPRFPMDPVPA